ncbi:sensor histidine kinase [Paenibacillus sp. 276b]|uniref:sensor histidine kinase n=1 Tax=Paenibacillus sp. 276b TaxID=1566277 RepID=UPI000896E07E|nr:sensor histidine kinase [Paenibacillus sp. 276b]SEA60668.1 two-component system, NarL family, sensor histidine kinase YdfH [Paenibacillus sp. 276b]
MNNMSSQPRFLHSNIGEDYDKITASRLPIIIWILLVAIVTVVMQTMSVPLFVSTFFFIAIMILHMYVYWRVSDVIERSRVLYLLIQASFIFSSATLMPDGLPVILIGLIPVLIGQTVAIFFETKKIVFVSFVLYLFFCLVTLWIKDVKDLILFIPLLLLMIVVVMAYALLYYRQVNARVRTQTFLRDLELTHQKVEELTLANERQRMARDLHDTLAQGQAGLIMQLEAVNAYLNRGSIEKAHEIVLSSMAQARQTLGDARKAIDDLRTRATPAVNFNEAIQDQLQRFRLATGVNIKLELNIKSALSGARMEHVLHILSETLTNVARHAQANQISINVWDNQQEFHMVIKDNGRGFNIGKIGMETGHYGLIGIYERARLIGGHIHIESNSEGTTIDLSIPV